MTDDLVERLLDWPYQGETMAHEAADHIEALTADCDRLREALWAILACETPNANATVTRMVAIARAALKGETP